MGQMYKIADFAKEINRCIQCNFCLQNCPVYLEDAVESSVARGRLNLIQALLVEKTLVATERAGELLNRCLLCTNCVQGCPSGIPVDDIVITARAELHKEYGFSLGMRFLLKQVVNRSTMTNLGGWAVSIAKRLNLAPDAIPHLVSKPFEQRYLTKIAAKGEVRGRVAYFIGCATNYLYPETGEAVVKVLTECGYEVIIPEDQHCCGIPALAHGEMEAAQDVVRWNAARFADLEVDAVITDCTSCGYMLKVKAAKTLPTDDPYQGKVEAVAKKVVEITEFINREGILSNLRDRIGDINGKMGEAGAASANVRSEIATAAEARQELAATGDSGASLKVTYHVPCHRAWSPNLVQAPRQLVPNLPDVQLVEMKEPQKCCGAGGSFFVDHESIASSIRGHKLEDILSTEADAVMTQCPACRYYLSQGLQEKVQVVHPVELLAQRITTR